MDPLNAGMKVATCLILFLGFFVVMTVLACFMLALSMLCVFFHNQYLIFACVHTVSARYQFLEISILHCLGTYDSLPCEWQPVYSTGTPLVGVAVAETETS